MSRERIISAVALILFTGMAAYQLALPGLHYDEAKEAGINAMELIGGVRDQAGAGEMVVALVGDEATLKRFFPEGESVRLQPANRRMEPIYAPASDVRIQGVVARDGSRASSGFSIAPRVYIALAQLERTGLVATGSRDMSLPENWWLHVMGRLRPGATMEAAEENLDGLSDDHLATFAARAVPQPGDVLRQATVLAHINSAISRKTRRKRILSRSAERRIPTAARQ